MYWHWDDRRDNWILGLEDVKDGGDGEGIGKRVWRWGRVSHGDGGKLGR